MFKTILHGLAIGIANIIPGVSGGTMAVILHIYDKLINSINHILSKEKKQKETLFFLFQIGVGAGLGIIIFAKIFEYLISTHPQPTYFFFLGLILGSIPIIYKTHPNMTPSIPKAIPFLITFFCMIILFILNPEITTAPSELILNTQQFIYLFFSGAIAAGTMIIPGLSGSLMLYLLGTYTHILHAINTFHLPVIVTVGTGAIIGIIIISKLINWCLRKHPVYTYYAILGLLVGSIPLIWPGFSPNLTGLISILVFSLGYFGSQRLDDNSQ